MTNGLNQETWQDVACDDLMPALRFLGDRYHIRVWKFSADPQGQWARLYLNKNLSRKAMVELRDQCANSPQIHFGTDWLICDHHNVSVYSSRTWHQEHRLHRPLWLQVTGQIFLLFSSLLLVAGGVFVLISGLQSGAWKDIGEGGLSILLFGFSFYSEVQDLIALAKRIGKPS
jgi:hypothetical protein